MKKQIWKFPIEQKDRIRVTMPIGAEILTVQEQRDHPCIWALVDPNAQREERIFEVFGTGHEINYDMGVERKYINTFQLAEGDLVFHLFERI